MSRHVIVDDHDDDILKKVFINAFWFIFHDNTINDIFYLCYDVLLTMIFISFCEYTSLIGFSLIWLDITESVVIPARSSRIMSLYSVSIFVLTIKSINDIYDLGKLRTTCSDVTILQIGIQGEARKPINY